MLPIHTQIRLATMQMTENILNELQLRFNDSYGRAYRTLLVLEAAR
jgi:hypothetical protein